jgi:hypothetical protein
VLPKGIAPAPGTGAKATGPDPVSAGMTAAALPPSKAAERAALKTG